MMRPRSCSSVSDGMLSSASGKAASQLCRAEATLLHQRLKSSYGAELKFGMRASYLSSLSVNLSIATSCFGVVD